MSYPFVVWDLDDDDAPENNTQHVGQHGITREDVQDVLETPERIERSRSSDRQKRCDFGIRENELGPGSR